MKKLLTYIILTAAALLTMASCSGRKSEQAKRKQVDTIPMLIQQVKRCSKLYTAEYKMHKIVTHDDEVRLKGKILQHDYDMALPIGTRKIAIPIDATIKAYVDMAGFGKENIRRNGKKIEILLPDPRIELTSSRINHGEIKKYVALMRQDFSDAELADYEQQGRQAIINDIPQTGITEMAKESAAKVLVAFFVGMGFDEKDITVTYRKDFTPAEIMKMVETASDMERKE